MLIDLSLLVLSPFAGRMVVLLASSSISSRNGTDFSKGKVLLAGNWQLIELAAVVLTIWTVLLSDGAITILSCALMLWLLCLSVVDMRAYLLPDVLTLPLIPIGLMVVFLLSPGDLSGHVIGAAMGWGFFALVGVFFVKFRGQIGLGGGDAKLLAGAGAWLGWEALPTVIVIAALAGLAYTGARVLSGKSVNRATRIPFGPFLAMAFLGVWLHGPLLLI